MNKLPLLFLLTFLIGCTSSQEAFNKGDYNASYKLSLKQLKKGKSIEENKEILKVSLENIIEEKNLEKEKLISIGSPKELEKAIKINTSLQEKISKAQPFIRNIYDDAYANLISEESNLKKDISNIYISNGLELLDQSIDENNKFLAQDAYRDFRKAKKYKVYLSEIDSLQRECVKYGRVNYVIQVNTLWAIGNSWEINRQFDDLEDEGSLFLSVVFDGTPTDETDCVIEISFSSLDVDYDKKSDTRSFEEKVIKGYETITNDNGEEEEVPVYEDVEGEVEINLISKVATLEAIVDVQAYSNNCNVGSERFERETKSDITNVEVSGDERAIPKEYLNGNKEEHLSDDKMMELLLEQLYEEIEDYIF